MTAAAQTRRKRGGIIGPYSKTFRRGSLGRSIDGRSELGRYVRDIEQQLLTHVGPNPSIAVNIQVQSIVKMMVQQKLLDEKVATGVYSDLDRRTLLGLHYSIRRALTALGPAYESEKPKTSSLDALIERINSRSGAQDEGARE